MDFDVIVATYKHCRANKRHSLDNSYFELHWERDLVRLTDDINARDLVPLLYSFIRTYPCGREVNACQMPTKIVQDYFDIRVRPLIDRRLTDRTFNNRKGFGPDVAVRCLQEVIRRVSHNYTRDCWIIERDIQAYFPSANLQRTYDSYRAVIESDLQPGKERDDLLYILQRTVWSYPSINTRLKSPRWMWDKYIEPHKSVVLSLDVTHGAALGNQFYQVSQNFDINDFDHRQVDVAGIEYLRYVDDRRWVVENKEAGLAYVNGEEAWLEQTYGYKSHPLKRQVQHYSKGGYFLGFYYKYGRLYISNRVVRRAKRKIREWNRLASVDRLKHFLASVNSYFGRMKQPDICAFKVQQELVALIAPAWLRYCHYDQERRVLVANPGYTHNELLCRKYHFKIKSKKHNGNTSNSGRARQTGVPPERAAGAQDQK